MLQDPTDFEHALDSVADVIPMRRSLHALRTDRQLQAWASYASELEDRLDRAYAQLAAATKIRHIRQVLYGAPEHEGSWCWHGRERGGDDRLELLARVRAEQLMSLRLLNLLARCADMEMLAHVEGEAGGSVLDAEHRRELRARDLQESRAEHEALERAVRDEVLRTQDGRSARRVGPPLAEVGHEAAASCQRSAAR